jgi:hypothetical protein
MWCHFHQPQSQPQPHPNFAVFHPCRSSFLFVISTNSSPLSYPSFQLQTQSLFPCLSCLLFPPPVPRRKTTLVTHTWAGKQIYTRSSTPILRSLQDGLQPIAASCEASVSHAQSATGPTKPIIRQSVRSTRCACEIRVHPPPLIDGALTTTVWKRCGRSDYRACVAETRGTCCMVAGKGFRRLSRDTWRRERLPPDLRIGLCGTRRGEEHGVRDSSHGDWDKKGLEAGGLVWRLIWKGHACGGRG